MNTIDKFIGYFEDVGLRNARLNFKQIEPNHLMGNIIYNELKYRGYMVDAGVVIKRESNYIMPKQKEYLKSRKR